MNDIIDIKETNIYKLDSRLLDILLIYWESTIRMHGFLNSYWFVWYKKRSEQSSKIHKNKFL